MFLLGAWKSFDELEECLTLDELIEAFNGIIERENRRMEFEAKLAGASIDEGTTNNKQTDTDKPSLADRLRARANAKRQEEARGSDKPQEFSQGVAYQVIGG